MARPVAGSSNGRTPDSGSGSQGSSPCPAAPASPLPKRAFASLESSRGLASNRDATRLQPPVASLSLAADNADLLPALLLVVGLVLGLVVARWWALIAPVAFAVYVAIESEVDELPPWLLGVLYGLVGAVGVAAGVLLRRFATQRRDPS
jgi:hypothetical protein